MGAKHRRRREELQRLRAEVKDLKARNTVLETSLLWYHHNVFFDEEPMQYCRGREDALSLFFTKESSFREEISELLEINTL